ncbi:MAG: DUF188 domain-containing protein [Firmicutes bacterium]|jgi:uncharacterized protein YaiI (UPF0178 family)|nr:DUF188 domain-containing protein [Bacillota bacterium]
MFKIIVDADACPRSCLGILKKHRASWGYHLLTISSVDHQIESCHHIMVEKGKDSTDLAVINSTNRGDIVVTQDWGLAALVLGKGAYAISPAGRVFNEATIVFLLEERSLKAKFRRAGGRTRGPSARTAKDDRRFEANFLALLAEARNSRD